MLMLRRCVSIVVVAHSYDDAVDSAVVEFAADHEDDADYDDVGADHKDDAGSDDVAADHEDPAKVKSNGDSDNLLLIMKMLLVLFLS
jgi:hypothetical protein